LSNDNLSWYLLQDVPAYKNVTEELVNVSRKYKKPYFFCFFLWSLEAANCVVEANLISGKIRAPNNSAFAVRYASFEFLL